MLCRFNQLVNKYLGEIVMNKKVLLTATVQSHIAQFHKPLAKKENGIYILNPSSISLPKEGTNSYGIYENDCFTIKTFDNEIVKQQ